MDFQKLVSRYNQFGGFRLVIEYAKLGVLRPAIKAGVQCLLKRQSFKRIYPEVLKYVEPILEAKYSYIVQEFKNRSKVQDQEFENSRINSTNLDCTNRTDSNLSRIRGFENRPIWFCWLQGLQQAPPIVKACYSSLKSHLSDREIKVINNKNWKEYVEFPDYVIEKWEKGRIPAALFSDLLRLELLLKYGGTWIDSTVLCTGLYENQNDNFLDADLFLFQYTKPGSIPVSISNWFITACSNNEVLIMLRDMLYAYWKDYDCTLDYYIFHLFFSMLSKKYPEKILAMPYGQSMNSLVLMHHLEDKFKQEKWDKLTQRVSFHKLAFRVSKEVKEDKENYFNKIISLYT